MVMEEKPLYRMYHHHIEELANIKKIYQWRRTLVSGRTQRQESIEPGVYYTRQDPRCNLCKDAPEIGQQQVAR